MPRFFLFLVSLFLCLGGATVSEAKGRERPDNKIRTVCPVDPCCYTECDCHVESVFDGVWSVERYVLQEVKSPWRTCALKQVEQLQKQLRKEELGCYDNPSTGYETAQTWIQERCGGNAMPVRMRAELRKSDKNSRMCVRVRLKNGFWGLNCP